MEMLNIRAHADSCAFYFADLRIDMRPVMKNNPWPRRLQHVPMAGMLILIAVLSTKPITLTGVAISLCTIPFFCLAVFAVVNRWGKRFGGSKFMNIIAVIFLFAMVVGCIPLLIIWSLTLGSISARLSGRVCRSAILGRYAASNADSLGIASFGGYGLADNKSVPFFAH
jgi:hypothetical protein